MASILLDIPSGLVNDHHLIFHVNSSMFCIVMHVGMSVVASMMFMLNCNPAIFHPCSLHGSPLIASQQCTALTLVLYDVHLYLCILVRCAAASVIGLLHLF